VLIVDDNATNQRVLRDIVTAWECTATHAYGAGEALVLLRQMEDASDAFDVILTDLNMPDIDGYGLAQLVRADERLARTPIIMLTSSSERGDVDRSPDSRIVAYLTKPVRSGQLRRALHLALRSTTAIPSETIVSDEAEPQGDLAQGSVPASRRLSASSEMVLLVEDNVVNQKVFSAMLGSIGYRVEIAVNGFDALAAMDRSRYAAVFMDCQMPVMDGYQTTGKIREREGSGRHTNVIAVTASAMASDRTRCLEAGMDDYMTKPIKAAALASMLDYWVHGAGARPDAVETGSTPT
jgi:CheY-like chemotaxis protein